MDTARVVGDSHAKPSGVATMTLISFRRAREASARLEVQADRRRALVIWACGAVVALALLSFYVYVLQQQQLHGRPLPQWQRTGPPKPGPAPAEIGAKLMRRDGAATRVVGLLTRHVTPAATTRSRWVTVGAPMPEWAAIAS
jgi:hypothetical protein